DLLPPFNAHRCDESTTAWARSSRPAPVVGGSPATRRHSPAPASHSPDRSGCAAPVGCGGCLTAVEVHSLVDYARWLGVQELVGGHETVADVDQPVLVPPARVARAAGEPEVGPVPAHLAGREREQPGGW